MSHKGIAISFAKVLLATSAEYLHGKFLAPFADEVSDTKVCLEIQEQSIYFQSAFGLHTPGKCQVSMKTLGPPKGRKHLEIVGAIPVEVSDEGADPVRAGTVAVECADCVSSLGDDAEFLVQYGKGGINHWTIIPISPYSVL